VFLSQGVKRRPPPPPGHALRVRRSKLLDGHRSGRRQDDARSDRRDAAANAIVEADEIAKRRRQRTIRIAITEAAFEAICASMPVGGVGYGANARGKRLIWLDDAVNNTVPYAVSARATAK
jgi:hypothetical protein